MKKIFSILLTFIVLAAALFSAAPVLAQEEDEGPIVYAVMFYSPSCGHCHEVITEDFPLWQEEFGDQLMLLFINVATEEGSELFVETFTAMEIPEDRVGGVPALVVADYYLVGGAEIPAMFPDIVRSGLDSGGIPVPEIPEILKQTFVDAIASETGEGASEEGDAEPTPGEGEDVVPTEEPDGTGAFEVGENSVMDTFMTDPVGNGISVVILLMLSATLIAVGYAVVKALFAGATSENFPWLTNQVAWGAMLVVAFISLVIIFTIVFKPTDDFLANTFSILAAIFMIIATVGLFLSGKKSRGKRNVEPTTWLLIVILLAGLSAASYLTYGELTTDEAFCGTVGDCNTVQSSEYALIFGFLPMAVLGLIGYLLIILSWVLSLSENEKLAAWAKLAMLAFVLFGMAMSTFLTFLEPFVIGATCAWCLTSALAMMLALWLIAKDGIDALAVVLPKAES